MSDRDDYNDGYDYDKDDEESDRSSSRRSFGVRDQIRGSGVPGTGSLPGRSRYEGPGIGRGSISRDDVSRREQSGGGGGSSGYYGSRSPGGGSGSGGPRSPGGGLGGGGPRSPGGGLGGGGQRPPDRRDFGKDMDKEKDTEKKEGGGLGGVLAQARGLFNRGGDDPKKDKPARPKGEGGGNPLARVTGTFSGFTSRFGGGGDDKPKGDAQKKDKPARPKGEGGGNPLARVTGTFSGFASRFGGGGDDKPKEKAAPPPKDDKPASPGPFTRGGGGLSEIGARGGGGDKPAQPKSALKTRSGIFGWFGGGGEDKRKSKTLRGEGKGSVQVENEGMSLDTKLDILGVALVLGSLALFFSAVSSDQGAITGQINSFTARLLGWGAIAVPLGMMATGIWLVIRHFGDRAPVIRVQRLIGIGMAYAGVLVLFQYIEAFNPIYDGNIDFFRFYGHNSGRGGGMIGTELYIALQQTIGEVGGVFVLLGWFIISVMLITGTSAAELSVIVISLWRSYLIARRHRAQKRAAQRLLAEQTKPEPIAVSRGAELPAGAQGALPPPLALGDENALPAPLAIEDRPIPIRMGGQMITSDQPGAPPTASTPPALPGATPSAQAGGAGGGLGRFLPRTARSGADGAARQAEKRAGGSLLGGLLGRGKSDEDQAPKPDGDAPAKPVGIGGMMAAGAAGALGSLLSRDPAPDKTPPVPDTPAATQTGEAPVASSAPDAMYQPPASGGIGAFTPRPPRRFGSPTPTPSPADELTPEDMRPAQPRGLFTRPETTETPAVSANQPESGASPFRRTLSPAPTPASEDAATAHTTETPPNSDAPTDPLAQPLRPRPFAPDRTSRLDQLRAGLVRPPGAGDPVMPAKPTSQATEPAPADAADAAPADPPAQPAVASPAPASPVAPPSSPTPATAYPQDAQPARSQPVINPPKPTGPVGAPAARQRRNYVQPDYRTLLSSGSEQDFDREALVKRARIIEETLQSFGAPGRVVEINTGPVITQFGVEPDYLTARGGKKSRVKVSAIAQLDKDLQLALNAKSIRIEAPVPGKGFVGVEVPNDEAATVSLRDVMESREFKRIKSPLAIALGQSVDGAPVAADLSSMPHLLIAGTTGSGKSVCVNAIIASLILNNSPEVVKFIMVDPKRVELTGYNGIPHLVAPVVVELERVVGVLKWVTREMDERYKKFSNAGARNIVDYNNHLPEGAEIMPFIVVIIDELADLMMLAPDETERTITRIAALARATGIHLVIATQRPSVDVVTGLIKANFPARVAFAVASGIDSRVILDQPGAEKLLGRGDMLYMSGDSPAPLRLQGVYVSDAEINNITRFWRAQQTDAPRPLLTLTEDQPLPLKDPAPAFGSAGNPEESERPAPRPTADPPPAAPAAYRQTPILWDADDDDDDDGLSSGAYGEEDELYEEAVELVRRLNKASVSLLQRRLRIGYTRAARLIDVMEERGVVGPATEGSKPRVVLPPR